MSYVLSASRLMTAGEVRKMCKEMRSNPTLLLALEFEYKRKIYESKKAAS
ncbi:hypothetical protein [Sporosarcina sp. FSL K6-1508]